MSSIKWVLLGRHLKYAELGVLQDWEPLFYGIAVTNLLSTFIFNSVRMNPYSFQLKWTLAAVKLRQLLFSQSIICRSKVSHNKA